MGRMRKKEMSVRCSIKLVFSGLMSECSFHERRRSSDTCDRVRQGDLERFWATGN